MNMRNPTTTFPWSTKTPKAFITAPASPCFVSISLVDDMFSPSLKSVVMRRSDGNIENSSDSDMFMLIISITSDMAIFIMNITSSTKGLSGIIRSSTMTITKRDTALFKIVFIPLFSPLLSMLMGSPLLLSSLCFPSDHPCTFTASALSY